MSDYETLLIESHYLPSIEYFCQILAHQGFTLEHAENYQKQTYRNRCKILTAHQIEILTIPVIDGSKKICIKDTRIDNTQNWQKNHWRTIQSAYGKSPFFEYYADNMVVVYQKPYSFLLDINVEILTMCLRWLKITREINFSNSYNKAVEKGVNDLRGVISTKNDNRPYQNFVFEPYTQVFGNKFAHNLSIIDLICAEGPNSKNVLELVIKKSRI